VAGGPTVDPRAPPAGVLRHMRGDVQGPQGGDEIACVMPRLAPSAIRWRPGTAATTARGPPRARPGRSPAPAGPPPPGRSGFHQRVAHVGEFGLLAPPLAAQPGVRVVGAPLAMEVARRVAAGTGRSVAAVLEAEALHTGPGFDERAVNREMLVRQQAAHLLSMAGHRRQEAPGDVAIQQPVGVLGEHGGMPDPVLNAQADEPAEQQVAIAGAGPAPGPPANATSRNIPPCSDRRPRTRRLRSTIREQ